MIPDEAVDAAVPYIEHFLMRRGVHLRGEERRALAAYVIGASTPHMLATKVAEAKANHGHITEGGDGYSAGFHYALHCVEGDVK